MKQNITKQQVSILSRDKKSKLINWYNKKEYGLPSFRSLERKFDNSIKNITLEELPMLNIGEMIDFIGEDWLQYITTYCDDCKKTVYPDNNNLCDSLWEITKKLLK